MGDEVFAGIGPIDGLEGIDEFVRPTGQNAPHAVRPPFVSLAANGGVNRGKMPGWAGRSTLQVTLGYYHGPSAERFGGSGAIPAPRKHAAG